jgi:integrase/recombinase XerD
MLWAYRRHEKGCSHRTEGRKYSRCGCPLWVDGRLNGIRVHKSLGTRDRETALQGVRDLESVPKDAGSWQRERITAEEACVRFVADLEARRLKASTVRKYRLLFKHLTEFAKDHHLSRLDQLSIEILDEFRCQWKDGPQTVAKKLERLRAFFRFAQRRKWVGENPANDLKAPKYVQRPTMPFTEDEVKRILAAVDLYIEQSTSSGLQNARRLRAMVLLLRYTGMRISDVVALETCRIKGNRLLLYTQKTGVPVHTVLPKFVISVLESTPRKSQRHFFWSGEGKLESIVRSWQTRLRKLFLLASVPGHPHRFRDTLAVALLLAGVPIERVAVLLGHQSVRVTEKHYSPWVYARQQQLEADLESAWARDPLVQAESEVTRRLRGGNEIVN